MQTLRWLVFMLGLKRGIEFQKVKEGVPDRRTKVANRDKVRQARCHEGTLGSQAKQTQVAALPCVNRGMFIL